MPLTTRGSVSARLRVRFSAVSAARNSARSLERISIPPGSMERKPSSPATTCSEARRFVPASVSTSEAWGKSNAARFWRPASFAFGERQWRRPAIIRCSTSQRSPSTPMAMRLPIRRKLADDPAFHTRKWRLHCSQQKSARESHALERLADDARFESADVRGNVGQFRHDYQIAGGGGPFAINSSQKLFARRAGLSSGAKAGNSRAILCRS